MKTRLRLFGGITLLLVIFFSLPVLGKGFSSQILSITSIDFPSIKTQIKVFTPEPEELKPEHFTLSEEGNPIKKFSVATQKQKHYIALVLDRSSSIEQAMPLIKKAAAQFAAAMISDVEMCVVSFGSDIDLNQDFTKDSNELVQAINKLRPWGGTALYDALYRAAESLNNQAGKYDWKTIVCLTDGRDESPNATSPFSTKTVMTVTEFCQKKGIRIITLGLGNGVEESILKEFAQSTKGWFLHAKSADQLAEAYNVLGRRMKLERSYVLQYTTPRPEADGTKRELTIVSQLKGETDQGKGFYIAPSPQQEVAKAPKKESRRDDWETITGPFITGPLTPPHGGPVILPNKAYFNVLDYSTAQNELVVAKQVFERKINAAKTNAFRYLDLYTQKLNRMRETIPVGDNLSERKQKRATECREILEKRLQDVEKERQEAIADANASLKKATAYWEELRQYVEERKNSSGQEMGSKMIEDQRKSDESDLKELEVAQPQQIDAEFKELMAGYEKDVKEDQKFDQEMKEDHQKIMDGVEKNHQENEQRSEEIKSRVGNILKEKKQEREEINQNLKEKLKNITDDSGR